VLEAASFDAMGELFAGWEGSNEAAAVESMELWVS